MATLGALSGHFWHLRTSLGALWADFGVTYGCMRLALVPLSLIFRKCTFFVRILKISFSNLLNLMLLGVHLGATLEHFGGTLVLFWGDFGHMAVKWQV